MTMDRYLKIRKYIGPFEIVLILFFLVGVATYLEYREERMVQKQEEQQQQVDAVGRPVIEDIPVEDTFKKNATNPHFKVLDEIYTPFMVDSLCRFSDAEKVQGFLTMTKNAPFFNDLRSNAKEYYMWVQLDKYFPYGELLRITGVAENDEVIQFHFRREKDAEALQDALQRMNRSLQQIQAEQAGTEHGAE